jgi:hypothetical protein
MKSIQVKSHINANGILELCVPRVVRSYRFAGIGC